MSNKSDYRADIDGLRAIAVLSVVFFHASIPGFKGGYVGVDIFFVISGYLITKILLDENRSQQFSIQNFYRRRILRIFPAFFVMLTLVSFVSMIALFPGELESYAKTIISSVLFASNILFYIETNYFAVSSHNIPLLHTWSLAVEEQFYILWPIFILLFHSRPNKLKMYAWILMLLSCFAAGELTKVDKSTAFYLLPTRAWELMLGGIVAISKINIIARSRIIGELLAALGFTLLLASIFLFDNNTAFPGYAALLPCVGTALIIAIGSAQKTVIGNFLSISPMTYVGKISYSLYLWHWPIIVFSGLWLNLQTSPVVKISQILLSIIFAIISWRFIEVPSKGIWSGVDNKTFLTRSALIMLLYLFCASAIIYYRGFPQRFNSQELAVASYLGYKNEDDISQGKCFIVDGKSEFDRAECLDSRTRKHSLLLVGDSHAAHFLPGLKSNIHESDILQATMTGCRPVIGGAGNIKCNEFMNEILGRWVSTGRPDVIVLSGRWVSDDLKSLKSTIEILKERGHVVVVFGPIQEYTTELPRLLASEIIENDKTLVTKALRQDAFLIDKKMRELAQNVGFNYFSMIDFLCNQSGCKKYILDSVPLQFDKSHLTSEGSIYVVNQIVKSNVLTSKATFNNAKEDNE